MNIEAMGRDLCVSFSGGDTPHIGAVALAVPYTEKHRTDKTYASVSTLTVTGHRDDGLAREAAHALAVKSGSTVTVSCGIHLDDATADEIEAVLEAARSLIADAVKKIDTAQ